MLDSPPRATSEHDGRRRRASLRRRAILATVLAGALAWSLISFLAGTGESETEVTIIPGLGSDNAIGEVTTISSAVTAPKGKAQLQEGIAFARIDLANAFHRTASVHVAWVNAPNFSVQTQTANWQLRVGLYYPVRASACTFTGGSSDPESTAVTLAIDGVDHCLYRDTTATGPGVSTTSTPATNHLGTQLLAVSRFNAVLRPQKDQSSAPACDATTRDSTGCRPGSTATNEVQSISIGDRTVGTFTLTFDGQTTSSLVWDAKASEIEAALEALSNLDNVSASGGPLGSGGAAVTVTFQGNKTATDVPAMTVNSSLTGGTTDPAVTTTTAGVFGTDADARVYFVIGSLLNPGGTTPPGQQASIDGLRLNVALDQ